MGKEIDRGCEAGGLMRSIIGGQLKKCAVLQYG